MLGTIYVIKRLFSQYHCFSAGILFSVNYNSHSTTIIFPGSSRGSPSPRGEGENFFALTIFFFCEAVA